MTNIRIVQIGAAVLMAVVLGVLVFLITKPFEPQPIDPVAAHVHTAIETLDSICLSSYSVSEQADVHTELQPTLNKVGAGATADRAQEILRGAAKTLSEPGRLKDGAEIRACMERNLGTILEVFKISPLPPTTGQYPQTVETRISAHFSPAGGGADDRVVVALQGKDRIIPRTWLTRQPGDYYALNTGYPQPDESWVGTVGLVAWNETLSANRFAKICFKRPSVYSTLKDSYVLFDCPEGKVCNLDEYSPKWVDTCDPNANTVSILQMLDSVAFAENRPGVWTVPSLRAWRERLPALKGLGYTEFAISTPAFAGRNVYGVEVGLAVDGQPVLEDGLSPSQRPEPYSGHGAFTYGFGLRSLDMQGRYAGCDRLDLTLTPLTSRGAKLAPIKVSRYYAALRPLPAATLRSTDGGGTVSWSGVYKPPRNALENELFLTSVAFDPSYNTASMRAALEKVDALKVAFDKLGLVYNHRPLLAVVRPPLTKPVFALAVGAYPSPDAPDQFRFTFDYATAKALKSLLDVNPVAARIFAQRPSIYTTASSPERSEKGTPKGGCMFDGSPHDRPM